MLPFPSWLNKFLIAGTEVEGELELSRARDGLETSTDKPGL